MADVLVTPQVLEDLDDLVRSHGLPSDTRRRVGRSLRPLAEFPRMGRALGGRWDGARFILGPWPWLVIVYDHHEDRDEVVVLTMHDARSATSATSG